MLEQTNISSASVIFRIKMSADTDRRRHWNVGLFIIKAESQNRMIFKKKEREIQQNWWDVVLGMPTTNLSNPNIWVFVCVTKISKVKSSQIYLYCTFHTTGVNSMCSMCQTFFFKTDYMTFMSVNELSFFFIWTVFTFCCTLVKTAKVEYKESLSWDVNEPF